MEQIFALVQQYRPVLEVLNATGSLLALITWLIAIPVIVHSWWRGRGVRLEFSVMGIRAAALFGGAAEQWAARTPGEHPKAKAATVSRTLERAFTGRGRSKLSGRKVLWVDDRPDLVALEIQGFEALGSSVILLQDTEAALSYLKANKVDLVISDMGRPPDDRAGYTLLRAIRGQGSKVPFLIYSGSRSPEHVREAMEKGAQGATNDPEELLALALDFGARG